MIIASIDTETTGLDPRTCQTLEIGVILWDTTDLDSPVNTLPTFHCYVTHNRIRGEAYALGMNHEILTRIARRESGYRYLNPDEVGIAIRGFVQGHASHLIEDNPFGPCVLTATGFNFDGFDRAFLGRLPVFSPYVRLRNRALSPATLFFRPDDDQVPNSDEVFRRAGVTVTGRHTSIGDARGVIEVLRSAFRGPSSHTPCPDPSQGGPPFQQPPPSPEGPFEPPMTWLPLPSDDDLSVIRGTVGAFPATTP